MNTVSPSQVHSLTARSVPRYFREGLKNSKPRPPNRNIINSTFVETPVGTDFEPASDRHHQVMNGSVQHEGTNNKLSNDTYNKDQYMQKLPVIPQESASSYHTPMESTYYNFTSQQSLPGFINNVTYSKDSFNEANNFTKMCYSSEPKSLSHLPSHDSNHKRTLNGGTSTVISLSPQNDHVTVTYNGNCSSQQAFSPPSAMQLRLCGNTRDTSPDHLGIPVSRATLMPSYHRSAHPVSGDTSDESSTSTASPPRYSRRPARNNSSAGHGQPATRCK